MTNLDSILKSRDTTLLTKSHKVKAMVFPVVIYWCESWTVRRLSTKELMLLNCGVGEDSWEPLRLQGAQINQSWRKLVPNIHWKDRCWSWNSLILWPPDVKNWFIGKDPDAGKDWRQEEKGVTEDEMAGWHHLPSGHEFEQTPGDDEGQGSLPCCSPRGCKDSDTT